MSTLLFLHAIVFASLAFGGARALSQRPSEGEGLGGEYCCTWRPSPPPLDHTFFAIPNHSQRPHFLPSGRTNNYSSYSGSMSACLLRPPFARSVSTYATPSSRITVSPFRSMDLLEYGLRHVRNLAEAADVHQEM